jgi:hypothetical protein
MLHPMLRSTSVDSFDLPRLPIPGLPLHRGEKCSRCLHIIPSTLSVQSRMSGHFQEHRAVRKKRGGRHDATQDFMEDGVPISTAVYKRIKIVPEKHTLRVDCTQPPQPPPQQIAPQLFSAQFNWPRGDSHLVLHIRLAWNSSTTHFFKTGHRILTWSSGKVMGILHEVASTPAFWKPAKPARPRHARGQLADRLLPSILQY